MNSSAQKAAVVPYLPGMVIAYSTPGSASCLPSSKAETATPKTPPAN